MSDVYEVGADGGFDLTEDPKASQARRRKSSQRSGDSRNHDRQQQQRGQGSNSGSMNLTHILSATALVSYMSGFDVFAFAIIFILILSRAFNFRL
jgi:hypothetical protein